MKKYLYSFLLIVTIFTPSLFYAQQGNTPGSTNINVNIPNPTNAGNDLMSILVALLNNVVMPIAAVAVVVWIIWAGFGYLMAQGKPNEIAKANQRLMWSLIGGGILLGAVGISEVVQNTIESLLN